MLDFKKIDEMIELIEDSIIPEGYSNNEFFIEFFKVVQLIPLSKYLRTKGKDSKLPKIMNSKKAGEILIATQKDDEIKLYETKNLIMDFSKVTFMDSSGVGVVLGRYKKVGELGGTVTIRNADRLVKQILDMSGIFSLMKYEETEN